MSVPFEQSRHVAAAAVRHGFFGRIGGVSTGDYASLNMSTSNADDPGNVAENRARALAALDFPAHALATVRQTHSVDVVTLTAPPAAADRPEADAMVTKVPGIALGILTADCAPVLLADPQAGIVGAFHAGWKGALGGIPHRTVAAMAALGAEPSPIIAAIGPTISAANYEVGPDFAANLLDRHPHAAHRLMTPPGGREHFDLPGFVADQLRNAGVTAIDDLGLCTYAEPTRYFSHRHATHRGGTTGRQIAIVGLP